MPTEIQGRVSSTAYAVFALGVGFTYFQGYGVLEMVAIAKASTCVVAVTIHGSVCLWIIVKVISKIMENLMPTPKYQPGR